MSPFYNLYLYITWGFDTVYEFSGGKDYQYT